MSKSAVDYLNDFILKELRLTPEEQENYKKAAIKSGVTLRKEKRPYVRKVGKASKETNKIFREIENSCDKIFNSYGKIAKANALTQTEDRILNLLLQGYSYSDISEKLSLSLTTIKTHVVHLFQKKQVTSLQELIVLCLTGQLKGVKHTENKTELNENKQAVNMLMNLLG